MATDVRIGSRIGPYTLEALLGRGGMSTVYLAEDTKLSRRVAIKVMSEELSENEAFRTRFIREAKMAANLEHPNIVPVYDAGDEDGVLYLSMRVIRGTDLRKVINEVGAIDAERTLNIMRQVAGALDAAHAAGLVHRDVKPANILLSTSGEEEHAYLGDFGLTKHVSSKSGLTQTGQFMGTIDYVAPEQIRGEEVDGRTDLYSLGCVLYECLTGQVPYAKDQEVAILFAHLEDEPPKATVAHPELPAALDAALARAMAKRRDDRFESCTAFVQAVRKALVTEPAGRIRRAAATATPPTVVAAPPSPQALVTLPERPVEPHPSFPPMEQPALVRDAASTPAPADTSTREATSLPPGALDVPPPPEPARPAAILEAPAPPAVPSPSPPRTPPERRRRVAVLGVLVGLAFVGAAVAGIVIASGGSDTEVVAATPPAQTGESEATSPTAEPSPPVAEPPAVRAPRKLKATERTTDHVTLTWSPAPNGAEAVRFVILRNGKEIGTTDETTFVDDTVAPSTTYTYRVIAIAEDGSRARSEPREITTPAPPAPSTGGSGGSGGGGGEGCDGLVVGNDCV